jgi:hypothetical protein
MFFYSFSTYHGFDRVISIDTQEWNPWDLFLVDGKYMLCLGETISFQSLYEKIHPKSETRNPKSVLIEPSLLSSQTIKMIHNFVTHRFTTYKNALPLRLSEDIDTLLKRKPNKRVKKSEIGNQNMNTFDIQNNNIYTWTSLHDFNQSLISFLQSPISWGQRCIVFPSFWIMSQTLDIEHLKQTSWYLVMTSKTSPKQKDDAFRALKTGAAHTLITTHSQIFQDWYNLKYLLLIDQHTWYYKNQQEPRYHTADVYSDMAKIYGARLDFTGISLSM